MNMILNLCRGQKKDQYKNNNEILMNHNISSPFKIKHGVLNATSNR